MLTINNDGTVIFDNIKMSSIKSDSANVYTIEFKNTQSGDIFIKLDFNSKTYELGPIGGEAADKGTITNETTESTDISQYAGNWRLSVIDRLLTINKDGTVIFDNIKMSSIKSDGANVYTLEFKNTQSGDIFIKLDFNSKTYELGPIGREAADKGTITNETETSLGLKSYAGEWQLISDVDQGAGGKITIKEDGAVEAFGAIFVEIKNNGNEEYIVENKSDGSSITITLKFTDKNNGTYVFNSDAMTDTGKLKI